MERLMRRFCWDGGFVPHTKGPVKTDKKISLSVDEKQPP